MYCMVVPLIFLNVPVFQIGGVDLLFVILHFIVNFVYEMFITIHGLCLFIVINVTVM